MVVGLYAVHGRLLGDRARLRCSASCGAETAITPRRSVEALAGGAGGTLSVAATTATAGIIVGVVTLTGSA